MDLVEPILDGIINWVYLKITGAFITVLNELMSGFDASAKTFYALIGVTDHTSALFNVFFWIAGALSLGIFIFHIVILATDFSGERKNSIVELLIRFPVSLILAAFIRSVFSMLNTICDDICKRMAQNYEVANEDGTISAAIKTDFTINMASEYDGIILTLISIFLFIAMLIEFIKLLIEISERYIVAQLLIIASPLAGATYASRTTSRIGMSYLQMYLSQLFLLIMNRFFIFLFAFMLMGTGATTFLGTLVILAYLKCAQRIDTHMKALGLSVAQTGGNILTSLLMAGGSMAMMAKGIRGGASKAGALLEKAGSSRGNFAMASVGTKLKGMGNPNKVNKLDSAISNFKENEGLKHTNASNSALTAGLMSQIENGNYKTVANITEPHQTAAIKTMLGQNDSFEKITGLSPSSIQHATMGYDGTIQGVANYKDNSGAEANIKFVASTKPSAYANDLNTLTGMCDGVDRTLSISDAVGMPDGMKFENQVLAGTLAGVTRDTNRLSQLDTKYSTISEGNLVAYDSSDNVCAVTNIASRQSYYSGTSYAPSGANYNKPILTESEFMSSSKLNRYLPEGATITPHSFNTKDNMATFEWSNKKDSGSITISRVMPTDIQPGNKVNIARMGKEKGDFTVKVTKKTQSNKYV